LTGLKDSISNIYFGEKVGTLEMVGSELVAKFESVNITVDEDAIEYKYLKADFAAIDEDALVSATAGVDVAVALLTGNATYETDVVGIDSDEEDGVLSLETTTPATSKVTTLVANVPTTITLESANSSIFADGTYDVAYLTVTMDDQSVNKDSNAELYKALLSELNIDFSTNADSVTDYYIQKV